MTQELIARYLGRDPAPEEMTRDAWGKPVLHDASIAFSRSCAGAVAAVAVGPVETLGVDVERLRGLRDVRILAAHAMTNDELMQMHNHADPLDSWTFLRWWTCKEAVAKADGRGLRQDLHNVRWLRGTGQSQVWETADNARAWRVAELPCPAGYVAALALPMTPQAVAYRSVQVDATSRRS